MYLQTVRLELACRRTEVTAHHRFTRTYHGKMQMEMQTRLHFHLHFALVSRVCRC
jgi:hypothetical protein